MQGGPMTSMANEEMGTMGPSNAPRKPIQPVTRLQARTQVGNITARDVKQYLV
jgi:hypothetical protein